MRQADVNATLRWSGNKGERSYDWAVVSWPAPAEDGPAKSYFTKSLLVRRSPKDLNEKAYYYTHAPNGTRLKTLVEIAGMRWAIEECFEQAKQLTGLDQYEVKSWTGWYRHMPTVQILPSIVTRSSLL
jgi:hypothetical protein